MNRAQLVAEIQRKVHHETYTPEVITTFLNDIRSRLTSMYCLSPLKTIATVVTTPESGTVDLPTDFMSGYGRPSLIHVFNQTSATAPRVCRSLDVLLQHYPHYGEAGFLEAVATEASDDGAVLHLVKTPAEAQTLKVFYFKKPDDLTVDSDIPHELPYHLHRSLLVSGACLEIFTEIYEGDMDNASVNLYANQFGGAVAELTRLVEPYPRKAELPTDVMQWDTL